MKTQQIKHFLDQINDLIEQNGENAPITLGNLRDFAQEALLRRDLKEAQNCFFVTQEDVDLAAAQLSEVRLQEWLSKHYLIVPINLRKSFINEFGPIEDHTLRF